MVGKYDALKWCTLMQVVVLDEQGLDIGSEKMAQLVGDAYKTVQCFFCLMVDSHKDLCIMYNF